MKCDVLVIGAGPAGSSAAYWLARFGAAVILADKAQFPRDKPCGDGLAPGVEDMLLSMGLGDFLYTQGKPIQGIHVFSPEHIRTKIRFGDSGESTRRGWVVPRYLLDDALRKAATSAGALFIPDFNAQAPIYKQSRLEGVLGSQREHEIKIRTHLVIVATGANRTFIRSSGLYTSHPPEALATRTYLEGLSNLDDFIQVYLDRDLIPGYGWVFPTGEDRANIGCGVILNGRSTQEGSRRLRSCLRRLLRQVQGDREITLEKPKGYPIRSDFPNVPLIANGLLVVGEAAGLVDPITGEGIGLALRSGWLAARVASYALSVGDFTTLPLKVYEDALRHMFAQYFLEARQFLSWLDEPGVAEGLIRGSKTNPAISQALRLAIIEKSPAQGMLALKEML